MDVPADGVVKNGTGWAVFRANYWRNSVESYKIYLDCDGVICDFMGRCRELGWVDSENNIDWLAVNSFGSDFWADLNWTAGGREFYIWLDDLCTAWRIPLYTLSCVSRTTYRMGRHRWLSENTRIPIERRIYTKTGLEKAIYATSKSILIDDYGLNIKAFENAGGIGIKYETPDEAKQKLLSLLTGE